MKIVVFGCGWLLAIVFLLLLNSLSGSLPKTIIECSRCLMKLVWSLEPWKKDGGWCRMSSEPIEGASRIEYNDVLGIRNAFVNFSLGVDEIPQCGEIAVGVVNEADNKAVK